MTRDEHRHSQRSLARRVLARERKADIVGAVAAEGGDWHRVARLLAQIPTPANRRRCSAPNTVLVVLLGLAAAAELRALFAYDNGIWLVLDLVFPALFLVAAALVGRYRARGYSLAALLAMLRLGWWALAVAAHQLVSAPAVLVAAQVVVCIAVAALAVLVQHRLLPESSRMGLAPRTDAEGKLVFEE